MFSGAQGLRPNFWGEFWRDIKVGMGTIWGIQFGGFGERLRVRARRQGSVFKKWEPIFVILKRFLLVGKVWFFPNRTQ